MIRIKECIFMAEYQKIIHPIEPVYNKQSRVLILGSFPSVKSRENQFFYGHPQNRFWKVLAKIYKADIPVTNEEKRNFLLNNRIAVWDVIHSCEIIGSSDSSIKDVTANDLSIILDNANINYIYVNGKKAEEMYKKYIYPDTKIKAICLPSTSPANAAWNLERLVEVWCQIKLQAE